MSYKKGKWQKWVGEKDYDWYQAILKKMKKARQLFKKTKEFDEATKIFENMLEKPVNWGKLYATMLKGPGIDYVRLPAGELGRIIATSRAKGKMTRGGFRRK